jgi:two-component system CheB/CheR fusion protein
MPPQQDERNAPPPPLDADMTDDEVESAVRIAPQLAFPVVVIGASAGGFDALEALTRTLSGEGMAFIIQQHAGGGRPGGLGEVLARCTRLRCRTIEDRTPIEPGTIYIAPPEGGVEVAGGALRLVRVEDGKPARHSVDALMRSLALAGGTMAIGVVLSGSGTDGTLGLQAIKNEGGITFVQDPSTAAQTGMPQSAIDAGYADFCLPPAKIGQELMRLAEHPYVSVMGALALAKAPDPRQLARVFVHLRALSGVDFTLYKQSTIERRIGRRMALHRFEKLEDYVALLDDDLNEVRSLYGDLLIGVTHFFRDVEPFDALRNVVFPHLLEDRPPGSRIRIWVAGCATGEEAYSMAIALLEYLGDRASQYRIQVFATDLDEDALVHARNGEYPPSVEVDVTPERLQRFFVRTDGGYQVARRVRDLVVFSRHDLGKDPPFSSLDLVACRNVLIYMQAPLQRRVLGVFHYALAPEGCLLLGASESVGDAADLFSPVDRKLKVYRRRDVATSAVFELGVPGHLDGDEAPQATHVDRPQVSVMQIADRKVIEKYAPPGVVVDDQLDILHFRGKTGAFLEPAPGQATLSLLKLMRPELVMALRATLHRARAEGVPASSAPVPIAIDQTVRLVCLDVIPLPEADPHKCLVVLFREVQAAPVPEGAGTSSPRETDRRVLDVERELATTKEYLQSTVEELEAANEELQSSNEELQSSNEELQSTNEELETSKEELQSTNEELATVNDELHERVQQLSVANDDLQNVLLLSSAAVLIVDPDLRIRRFSSAAEKLLNLIPGDVGRPIGYLRNVMSARDVEHIAAQAIESVSVREQRVRAIDGAWYLMRLAPYRTADHAIRGLVVEFSKTSPPAAVSEGPDLSPLGEQLLSVLPHALMILDRRLTLGWANRAFFETFAVGPSALGRPLTEAWGSPSPPPELWAFLEDLVAGNPVRDVLIEHPFGRGGDRPMRFCGRLVRGESESAAAVLVHMQDV